VKRYKSKNKIESPLGAKRLALSAALLLAACGAPRLMAEDLGEVRTADGELANYNYDADGSETLSDFVEPETLGTDAETETVPFGAAAPNAAANSNQSQESNQTQRANGETADLNASSRSQETVRIGGENDNPNAISKALIDTAKKHVGAPFVMGGETPKGFDNSGFVYYVLKSNGYVHAPRGTKELAEFGTKINTLADLKAGDLLFFSQSANAPEFTAIYIGNGKLITCPYEGETVSEIELFGYYSEHFFSAARVA